MAPKDAAEPTLNDPTAGPVFALRSNLGVDAHGTGAISLRASSLGGASQTINLDTLFIAGVILAGIPFLT